MVKKYQKNENSDNFKDILSLFANTTNVNYRPNTKVTFDRDQGILQINQEVSQIEQEKVTYEAKINWNELRFDETNTTFGGSEIQKIDQDHYAITVPNGFVINDQDVIKLFKTTKATKVEIKQNEYDKNRDGWHNITVKTINSIGDEEVIVLTVRVAPTSVLKLRGLFAFAGFATEVSANGDLVSNEEGYFIHKEDLNLIEKYITDVDPVLDFPGGPLIANNDESAIGVILKYSDPSKRSPMPEEWLPGMEDWTNSAQYWQYLPMDLFKENKADVIIILDLNQGIIKFGYIFGSTELVVMQWETHANWVNNTGIPFNPIV